MGVAGQRELLAALEDDVSRFLYGADGGTTVADAAGNAITGRACQIWTQATAGAQVTDTQTPVGTPTGGTVTTDNRGRIVFLGPDGQRSTLWADAGDGTRWAIQPADTDRVARAEVEAAAVLLAQVGQPGGVAALGSDGTVPADQLPDLSGTYLPEPAAAGVTGQALLLGSDGSPYWGDAGGGTTASWAQLETATAPRYIAHRGGSLVFPENTLDAFMGATQLGVDAIELDVWLTRDGGLYVMHDGTVDRTTNLAGNTKDQTVASVLRGRIDAATWFASTWPSDLRIPTLDDVLQRISPLVPLILHVDDTFAGAGAATVAAVQQHERAAGVLIACWSEPELAAARAAGIPTLLWSATGILAGGRTYAALIADGTQYLGVDVTQTTNATMQDAMDAACASCPSSSTGATSAPPCPPGCGRSSPTTPGTCAAPD
jgi:glycerophosphoryl diester phosphodiesterase